MSEWKLTIPITRAYEREDGKWILVGEASGPEQDNHKTRMLPEAIADFARQIKERVDEGNPIPYMDSHLNRGALVELGKVINGWVTEDWHLRTEVELDSLNPASRYIYESIQLGKLYGQSIAGTVERNDMVIKKLDNGEKDVAFKRVTLKEISNTTSPSWTPSLGTVLVRSLDQAEGDDAMSDNLEVSAQEEETLTPESTERESEQPSEETAQADEQTTEERAEEEAPADEAEQPITEERARLSQKDKAALIEQYNALGALLTNLGVTIEDGAADTTTEAPESASVENSDSASETGQTVTVTTENVERMVAEAIERAIAPLKETIDSQAEYIKALENLPAGKLPPGVTRQKFEGAQEAIARLGETQDERMRNALAILYGETR